MNRSSFAIFWMVACNGAEPEPVGDTATEDDGRDAVREARQVFSGCVGRTFDALGELSYTTTYDAWGREIRVEDAAGEISTTTWERVDDALVSSVTVARGEILVANYDAHEHVEDDVRTFGDGTEEATVYRLEHDGARLVASESTFGGTVTRSAFDDCENLLSLVSGEEVLATGVREYDADCLPSRDVLDLPTLGFVQTTEYEGGRPILYRFTGAVEGENPVEWTCP